MMKLGNMIGSENTLKCGLYPIHSAKTHLIHMCSKQVFKQIYMSSNTQLSTKAPHGAILTKNTFTVEYNLPCISIIK